VLAGCSSGDAGDDGSGGDGSVADDRGGSPSGGTLVEVTDKLAFEPETLAVAVGDTVTWRTAGSTAHTVTAYGERIPADADNFAGGGFDAEDAGSDASFCIPHERVDARGTV